MRKIIPIILVLAFALSSVAFAQTNNTVLRNIIPETDNLYDFGTSTDRYKEIWAGFNTSGAVRCLQITAGGQLQAAGAGCGTGGGGDPNVILTLQGGTTYYQASTTGFSFYFPDGFVSNASSTVSSQLNLLGILNASSTVHVGGVGTSTFSNALRVGTTTSEGTAKFEVIDTSGSLGADYGMIRTFSTDPLGGNYDLRMDSPQPDIEFIETDGTGPEGEFEVGVNQDVFYLAGRNAADTGFEQILQAYRLEDGGRFVVGSTTPSVRFEIQDYSSSATGNYVRLVNLQGSAGAAPGLAWYNSVGNFDSTRLSSAGGASFQNSNFRVQVADSSKVLQERLLVDVNGNIGVSSSTPSRTFSVQGDGLFSGDLGVANLIATGTATTTNLVATNATTTNLSVDGGTLNGGTDSAGTLLLFPTTHPTTGALVVAGNIRGNVNNTFNLGTNAFRYAFLYAQQGMQIAGNQFAFQIANNSGSGLFFNSTDSNIALQGSSADIHRSFLGSPIADGAFWHQPRTSDPTLAAATATGTMHVYDNGVNLTWLKMKASSTQNAVDIEQKQTFAVTPASTIDLSIQPYTNIFAAWSSNEDETVNALGSQYAGQEAKFIIGNGGALPRTITFGTGFNANGNLIGTAGATATVMFVSDGVQFDEFSRTLGL